MQIPLEIDDIIVYVGGVAGLGFIYRKAIMSIPRRVKTWWRRVVWNQFWKLGLTSDLQIGGHCGCCGKWVPDVIVNRHWAWALCKKCAGEEPMEEDA